MSLESARKMFRDAGRSDITRTGLDLFAACSVYDRLCEEQSKEIERLADEIREVVDEIGQLVVYDGNEKDRKKIVERLAAIAERLDGKVLDEEVSNDPNLPTAIQQHRPD